MPNTLKKIFHTIRRACHLPNDAEVEQKLYSEIQNCSQHLERVLMQQRRLFTQRSKPQKNLQSKAPAPKIANGLEQTLAMIQKNAPQAYELWLKCQQAGAESYDGTPLDSCSVEGHLHAELFRDFIAPYLRGAALDIGCGPQPIPYYLSNYPIERIAGIDPLSDQKDHPFVFYKGLIEWLPWDDAAFNTVIIATSMDHFILLDHAIDEVKRVLHPEGSLLIWVSFTQGAPEYNPYCPDIRSFDKFHLFYFDRPWFEKLMSTHFHIDERFDLFYPGYQYVPEAFYALSPLHS